MTNIEWTDKTWNPVTGCTKVSPGCKHCYAEGIAERFFAKQYPPNADGSPRKFTDVRCHPERLDEPMRWKKPCMVFVNSMSDLFHEDVPEEFIGHVFATMALCPQHTFQVLTKRPTEMLDLIGNAEARWGPFDAWPLPNVWLGVSVESQKYADERIPLLLQTPAAVRFLSVEPMLEAVDLHPESPDGMPTVNVLTGATWCDPPIPRIDWVICGGESGPGARPFNLAWAESLLEQCRAAGVPFFMKQTGSFVISDNSNHWVGHKGGVTPTGNGYEERWRIHMKDRKGGDPLEWPESLRIREFPSSQKELIEK